jgi:hypothetical protein
MVRVKVTGFLAVFGVGRAISGLFSAVQGTWKCWMNLLADPLLAHDEDPYEDILSKMVKVQIGQVTKHVMSC